MTVFLLLWLAGGFSKLPSGKPSGQGPELSASVSSVSKVCCPCRRRDVSPSVTPRMQTEEIHNLHLMSSTRAASSTDANVYCLSHILRRLTASYLEINISMKTIASYQEGAGV